MPRQLISSKKQEWVDKFKPTSVMRGKTLYYNVSSQRKYIAKLTALVDKMTNEVENKLTALFKSNTAKQFFAQDDSISSQARILTNQLTAKFEDLFGHKAKPLAQEMIDQQDQNSKTALSASLKELSGGLVLKTDFLNAEMGEILTAAVAQNVSLIKSIPSKYMEQIKYSTLHSITTGNGLADLIPAFEKYGKITKKRAKNIAEDQTRKVYNQLNTSRQKALGLKQFEWLHSGGGQHPRELHIDVLNGQIYNLDNPPIIDEDTGERGIPGQLPNCRCTQRPVLVFNEGVPNDATTSRKK